MDRLTYAGIASYVLLTTINIDDASFLLNSNKISLPIIEVNVSLDWFGIIAPLLIFIAFAIYYQLNIIGGNQKEYGSFHEVKALPDWVFLLLLLKSASSSALWGWGLLPGYWAMPICLHCQVSSYW